MSVSFKRFCIVVLTLFSCVLAMAQTVTIRGSVFNENGEPVTGAALIEVATNNGVVTDANGQFSINVRQGANLEVSCLGYTTVTVTAQQGMRVVLQEDNEMLDEVVMVGYTTQRKSDLTGSITVVSVEDIKNSPALDVMTALQGRVPGMNVNTTGDPTSQASIRIRGIGTLNNTDPLYIVDGMPTTMGIKDINASDIESIQVLKDAASASIYGSRAANGVIIITTNRGQEGRMQINFNASLQLQKQTRRLKMLDTEGFGKVLWTAYTNSGLDPNTNSLAYQFDSNGNMIWTEWLGDPSYNEKPANTDWYNEVAQDALRQTYELTMSNANARGRYYLSLGVTDGKGVIKSSDYNRYNARINSSFNFLKDHVTVGENLTVSYSNEAGLADNYGSSGNVLQIATQTLSIIPVHTADGEGWAGPVAGQVDRMNAARLMEASRNNRTYRWRIFGSVYADIKPFKNLVFRTQFSPEFTTSLARTFRYPYSEGKLNDKELSTSLETVNRTNWTWSNTLTYNLEANKHRATFLLGSEMISNSAVTIFQKTQGYEIDTPNYMWPSAATGTASVSGNEVANTLSSFFGKIDYSYAYKYLLGLTVRYDGSSRFGKDNQYAFFPAVSVGWRISQEEFLKPYKWINDLKLRASWGTNGNQNIQNGAIYTLYDMLYGTASNPTWGNYQGTSYDIAGNGTGSLASGYRRTQQGNSSLKWETSSQIDLGIDYNFWNYKLYGSVDWFRKLTTDILIKPSVMAAAGEGADRYVNGATLQNHGIEIQVGTRGKLPFGMTYDVNGNISTWRNKVVYLPDEVLSQYGGNGTTETILGRCLGSYYGYTESGLYKTQAEVDNGPTHAGKGLGRIKWDDNNPDGVINNDDRVWFGTPEPLFNYGLNVRLGWNNFDFSMFWEGMAGYYAQTGTKSQTDFFAVVATGTNRGANLLNAWSPENPNSNIPAIISNNANDEGRVSTYLYEDHSFAKLRNLSLGYSLNSPKIKSLLGFERLRLYVTGQELIQITSSKFTGVDPEETSGYRYPRPISLIGGVQITF